MDDEQRAELELDKDQLALKVTYIWGDWTRDAGIKLGDLVVSIDGKANDMSIRQLHAYLQMNHQYGDSIPLVVRRNGERLELTMHLPDEPNE